MEEFLLKKNQSKKLLFTSPGEYRVILAGEGAEAMIGAALIAQGSTRQELKLEIIHRAPHTTANTLLKATAADQSMVHLTGTISIAPEAIGANSFLRQNILLLSANAKAEAVPNLEIQTNDVKCSHAATVSPIDPEQLFYAAARGLDTTTATALIVAGFIEEVFTHAGAENPSATIEAT